MLARADAAEEAELFEPEILAWQRDRDNLGGGISLRKHAEEQLAKHFGAPGLKRQEAKAQLMRSFDRLLSDEGRCMAYEAAIEEAIGDGARRVVLLGAGSLLPALLAAQAGAQATIGSSLGTPGPVAAGRGSSPSAVGRCAWSSQTPRWRRWRGALHARTVSSSSCSGA